MATRPWRRRDDADDVPRYQRTPSTLFSHFVRRDPGLKAVRACARRNEEDPAVRDITDLHRSCG